MPLLAPHHRLTISQSYLTISHFTKHRVPPRNHLQTPFPCLIPLGTGCVEMKKQSPGNLCLSSKEVLNREQRCSLVTTATLARLTRRTINEEPPTKSRDTPLVSLLWCPSGTLCFSCCDSCGGNVHCWPRSAAGLPGGPARENLGTSQGSTHKNRCICSANSNMSSQYGNSPHSVLVSACLWAGNPSFYCVLTAFTAENIRHTIRFAL